jgi:hypothetical protein
MITSNLVQDHRRNWRNGLRRSLASLLLALTACGGGVETGGTGAGAYVQGPVAGFGSVIVSGVRFDESTARVEDVDGTLVDRNQLRLGMMVEVDSGPIGDDGSGGRAATATRVRLGSELVGPVTAADPAGLHLAVLGQSVRLTPATVVDGIAGGAAALVAGDMVEVHGFVDIQNAGYVATRVERRSSAPATFKVRGIAREVNAVARTIRIGLQFFDLTETGVPSALVDGKFVRLMVKPAQVGGRWVATSAAVEQRSPGDHDEAEVEGLIDAFKSAASFSVNGVPVDASAALNQGLGVGVRVRVRGRTQAGVLVATAVAIRSDADAFSDGIDVRDSIASVDTVAQTFALRGITIFYGGATPPRFDNGSAADLAVGRKVRVRAELAGDRTRFVATRIEFLNN